MNYTLTAVAALLATSASCAVVQDWPHWRGANRHAKATGAVKLNKVRGSRFKVQCFAR